MFADTGGIAGDPLFYSFARSAKVGDVVNLLATGLGLTDPVYQAGEIPGAPAAVVERVTVEWNGVPMAADDVLYAGVTPGSVSAVYQVRVRVPSGLARPGTHNAVRMRLGTQYLSPEGTTLYVQ